MQQKVTLMLKNEFETQALAALVAKYSVCGDIIRLEGTLGMGKTTFARAYIQAMCGNSDLPVPSPTFTLVQLYDEGRLPIAHVDAYRTADPEEWFALDLDEYAEHGITLLEWGAKVESVLQVPTPPMRDITESEFGDCLWIHFNEVEGDHEAREITLEAKGTWCRRFAWLAPERIGRAVTAKGRDCFMQRIDEGGYTLTPLSLSASFRTYFRTNHTKPLIVMDAPSPLENVKLFTELSSYYEGLGVRVPTIIKSDEENGYLLLEDFGDKAFSKAQADNEDMMPWMEAAVDMLALMANASIHNLPANAPKCDVSVPWQEAQRYTDWYLPTYTHHATSVSDRAAFKQAWAQVQPHFSKVPQVACHWDCHIDNLMMLGDKPCVNNVGIVDFQDTVVGPVGVDLACLLEDRFKGTDAQRSALISRYFNALDMDVTMDALLAVYNLTLLFRFFKISGLWVRLEERDGRKGVTDRMDEVWSVINKACQHPAALPIKNYLDSTQK